MSKGVEQSSNSSARCPKVWNIRQIQGSEVQKCGTVVKFKGPMSKRVEHSSNSRVKCPKVWNIHKIQGSSVQRFGTFVKFKRPVSKSVAHSFKFQAWPSLRPGLARPGLGLVMPWPGLACA